MVSYNIGHLAYLNAMRYGLHRVFFGGFFIRGHPYTMETISFAINFWSKVSGASEQSCGQQMRCLRRDMVQAVGFTSCRVPPSAQLCVHGHMGFSMTAAPLSINVLCCKWVPFSLE